MRLALFSDIHGNLLAFEAALAHARSQGFDQAFILGDIVVGAPDSHACWSAAKSLGCAILRGNHERYVFDFDGPDVPSVWRTEQYAPVRWGARQFSEEEKQALRSLPTRLEPTPDLLLVHASARNDTDSVFGHTTENLISEMFAGTQHHLIIRAHNHSVQMRQWANNRTLITLGSVGLPMDGMTTAQYCLLDLRPDGSFTANHKSVHYDLDAALQRFHDTGYLRETGPMARLFYRELATASLHFVPFLHWYSKWNAQQPISLHAAIDRYFQM